MKYIKFSVTNTLVHYPNLDIVRNQIESIRLQICQNHALLCHQ